MAFKDNSVSRRNRAQSDKTIGMNLEATFLASFIHFDRGINASAFTSAASPIHGEKGVTLRYRTVDLLWRPVGCLVRFVAVIHPHRGCWIFLATDLTLDPMDIIRPYGVLKMSEAR